MYGGSAFLFYSVGYDVMRHHADTLTRPKIIDHAILLGIIGAASGALTGNGSIRRVVQFTMFFTLTLAPMSWWFKLQGGMPGSYRKPVNIFYENDVTPEEVERFRAMDETEILAHNMSARPGYGFVREQMKFEN